MDDKEMQQERKRRGGWPARTPVPGERVPVSWRMTPEFKTKLEQAAAQSGKSLAQEIEQRLEASFHDQRRLTDALDLTFGPQLSAFLMLLGRVMHTTGRSAGFSTTNTLDGAENWMLNPHAFDQVIEAANAILEAARPEGDTAPPATVAVSLPGLDLAEVHRNLGLGVAGPYLAAIADPESAISADLKRIGTETREKLGDVVSDRIAQNISQNEDAWCLTATSH